MNNIKNIAKHMRYFLLFVFMAWSSFLYAGENKTDTMSIHINNQVYELTVSVDSAKVECGKKPAAYVKLTKDGSAAGESAFPMSGNCPIEEDIGIEVSGKEFIIRIPYCDGFLFRIGYARFGYSEKYDDFVLTEYREEKHRQTEYGTGKQECRIQYLIQKTDCILHVFFRNDKKNNPAESDSGA